MFDKLFRVRTKEIEDNYVIVTYVIESSKCLMKAAVDIALGQSVGNPEIRNSWETPELFDKHGCIIMRPTKRYRSDGVLNTAVSDFSGTITISSNYGSSLEGPGKTILQIGFPMINTNWYGDGISHLVCQIMGGQCDIDHILKCRAIDIEFPEAVKVKFKKPRYGMTGIRDITERRNRPLLGGIMKPKTGLSPSTMLDMTKAMVDGGVDFIKEDEILSNPDFCPLEERVDLIARYQAQTRNKFVYCFAINGDPHTVVDRATLVADGGGNGVHINIWSGLGSYATIRKLNRDLVIHYQKSGDKVITYERNHYGISWLVLVKLAALCGVDTIHTGMFGGYLNDDVDELRSCIEVLKNADIVPALSCGMHPGLVEKIRAEFGDYWMANVGGALHGHPDGTTAGALAMRQAIDRQYGQEYGIAVNKWGIAK